MLDRRKLLISAAALSMQRTLVRASTSYEWRTTTPAAAGFVPEFAARLDQFVQSGRVPNLHGVIVARRGRIALERYYEGDDVVRSPDGRAEPARVTFTAEISHELRSVTKSIIGLLYGIALGEGTVPALDRPLLRQFPYTELPDMWQRRRWTIANAMTMTLGVDWNEDISYDDPRNSQTAMEAAPDRYRYVLEQPIVAVVGERWTYCGGATALIGKIIENATKQSLHDYARAVLFDPLGIGPTEWRSGRDGERNFASGLSMRPRDLARIGQMLLDGGKVGERQIVPAAWLEDSFTPAARISDRRQYGYHWYLGNAAYESPEGRRRARWIGAMGNGGQRLVVLPDLELVTVITAGNYNQPGRAPDDLMNEVVLPSIR
jgi:CubicO group peptidase (beta-lactamase class C family)